MQNIVRWKNDTRWYAATVQPTLFGEIAVMQSWGSRRDGLGNWMETIVQSPEQAEAMMTAIHKRRRQRHYQLAG